MTTAPVLNKRPITRPTARDPWTYVVRKEEKAEKYYLEPIPDFILPERIYGGILDKINRMLRTYDDRNRTTGILLVGERGCLAGDTMISINRGGKGSQITIRDAYIRSQGLRTRSLRSDGHYVTQPLAWDKSIKTRIRSLIGPRLPGLNDVLGFVYSGEKFTIRLTMRSGITLECTPDHKIYTLSDGWVEAKDCLHKTVWRDMRRPQKDLLRKVKKRRDKNVYVTKHHPNAYARPHRTGRNTQYTIEEHRAVYEAKLNNMTFDEYREALKDPEKVATMQFVDSKLYDVHHKDFNHRNNHPDNLIHLPKEEHRKLHIGDFKRNLTQLMLQPDKVVKIEDVGVQDTYDVQCAAPHHNFMANGIVVHNSGKTLSLQAISAGAREKLGIPTVIVNEPYCGDAFNLFVSQQLPECVLVFDEFEKVYRFFDQAKLLTLYEGVFQSKKLIVHTANNIAAIDQHFINRPGRIYYKIEFKGLEADFIRDYCEENLEYQQYIGEIIRIAHQHRAFNFDMLKALVEEMNRYGEPPSKALQDLNITVGNDVIYRVGIKVGDMVIQDQDIIPNVRLEGHPLNKNEIRLAYRAAQAPGQPPMVQQLNIEPKQANITSDDTGRVFICQLPNNVTVTFTRLDEKPFNFNDMF